MEASPPLLHSEADTYSQDTAAATPSHAVLNHYRHIAAITGKMLNMAYANEWDSVVALGEEYHQAVQRLRNLTPLTDEDTAARRDILVKILDNDASIRALAMPELERISRLLGDMRRKRNVLSTYKSNLPDA